MWICSSLVQVCEVSRAARALVEWSGLVRFQLVFVRRHARRLPHVPVPVRVVQYSLLRPLVAAPMSVAFQPALCAQ